MRMPGFRCSTHRERGTSGHCLPSPIYPCSTCAPQVSLLYHRQPSWVVFSGITPREGLDQGYEGLKIAGDDSTHHENGWHVWLRSMRL
jgi:hypothetical protein